VNKYKITENKNNNDVLFIKRFNITKYNPYKEKISLNQTNFYALE